MNYIYMKTVLRSQSKQKITVSIRGDDAVSAFVISPGGGGGQPAVGNVLAEATSSYSINAWAQTGHPLEGAEKNKFYAILSQGTSDTPVFAEGKWADVMPRMMMRCRRI